MENTKPRKKRKKWAHIRKKRDIKYAIWLQIDTNSKQNELKTCMHAVCAGIQCKLYGLGIEFAACKPF